MIFSVVFMMHIACWCYQIGLVMIGCRQLVNYCFIIHLDVCMCSFYCGNNFMLIMTFSVKIINNKVVDNLLMYLVLNFHSCRPNGLRVLDYWSCCQFLLILWTDLDSIEKLICLTLLTVESSRDDYKEVIDNFITFLESLVTCLL